MAQPACDMVMTWLTSGGHVELPLLAGQNLNEKITVIKEMEDAMFFGQQLPQRNPETFNKPAATLLVLEILNYRLFSFYR
ncbi:hypothetical protein L2E82_30999 [Cichorium intybus]|uniref:Uncharacterized protein n=1 Tax=Cichorium intybus TaxID=13427 RepID=A0ACB9D2A3_CICIN|nr:hypothetical protein L2E82_30999 [Cichorium intybus]